MANASQVLNLVNEASDVICLQVFSLLLRTSLDIDAKFHNRVAALDHPGSWSRFSNFLRYTN